MNTYETAIARNARAIQESLISSLTGDIGTEGFRTRVPDELDIRLATQSISDRLKLFGFAVCSDRFNESTFLRLSQQFGYIWHKSDVQVKPDSRWLASSSAALSLHTDNPHADIVAWRCHVECEQGSPTLIADLSDLPLHFSEHELELLQTVLIPIPSFQDYVFEAEPLIMRESGAIRLNYLEWFEPRLPANAEQAFQKFKSYLQNKREQETLAISLLEGQLLFIDNNRMLHGRGELPANTPRHLQRLWIKAF